MPIEDRNMGPRARRTDAHWNSAGRLDQRRPLKICERGTVTEILVLIPGLLCDAVVWKAQVESLGADYDVRVADVTGFSSIDDMAKSILAAMPDILSVAGHSMGARVALEMIRTAPDRISRLALLDTGVHPMQEGEPARRHALVELGRREGMRALADAWLPPMVGPDVLESRPELRGDLYAMVERMNPSIHHGQITALLGRADARQILPMIRCPVLIGVGENDAWSPPDQHRAIADNIPHARYVVFSNSGHMSPMEAPEAVTGALRDWMASPTKQED
jgi:pimeloyl-ACP methyl ester carboxylesterase